MTNRAARTVGGIDLALRLITVIVLLAPMVLIVVLSFSNDRYMTFPPHQWGIKYYRELAASSYWLSSFLTSLIVSVPAALLATLVGVPAVLATERSRLLGRSLLRLLGISPLLLPGVAYAIALYIFYINVGLVGTRVGVVIADTMLSLPFVILVTGAGLARVPRELELAAMGLGASHLRATVGITLRLLLPSIMASLVLAFVAALDEAVLINFVGGGQVTTLPKAIFESIQNGTDPIIAAIATVLTLCTGLLLLGAYHWRQRRRGQSA